MKKVIIFVIIYLLGTPIAYINGRRVMSKLIPQHLWTVGDRHFCMGMASLSWIDIASEELLEGISWMMDEGSAPASW